MCTASTGWPSDAVCQGTKARQIEADNRDDRHEHPDGVDGDQGAGAAGEHDEQNRSGGLSPHPSLILVVEGQTEHLLFPRVMDLFPIRRDDEYIRIENAETVNRDLASLHGVVEKAKQAGAILARPREYLVRVALPSAVAWPVALVVWAFGWAGGRVLVERSYEDAKVKVAEHKAQRAAKRAARDTAHLTSAETSPKSLTENRS